jgi:hypothetical protein
MFKGTVNFLASIKGKGVTFPRVEFNPNEPGVNRVEIVAEEPNGDEIRSIVHLAAVASHADGRAIAMKVNTDALNRITFFHDITIENARIISDQFSPLTAQPDVVGVSSSAKLYAGIANKVQFTIGIPAERLKADLEQTSPPGESNFGLFRSARQSMSPVEEFMHLYNILLMLCGDLQSKVDRFIASEEPAVKQTQDPRSGRNNMETVYTRLRNEFGHRRAGVNIDNTKAEMTNYLHGLNALAKRAIELLT